jgi:hypothetical protein
VIKTRIESLIERDYMERDAEDRKFLKYLAWVCFKYLIR